MPQNEIACAGAAIEARVYAEDPEHNFLPSAALIHAMNFKGEERAQGVRIDTGFVAGDSVTPYYDPMIAKVIVHGATRGEALAALVSELDEALIIRPKTNLAFLGNLLRSPEFAAGTVDTGFIDANLGRLEPAAPAGQKGRPRRRAGFSSSGARRAGCCVSTRPTRGASPIPSSSSGRVASLSMSPSTASPCE